MTLRHHVDVKTSSALPYMANSAKVYNERMALDDVVTIAEE